MATTKRPSKSRKSPKRLRSETGSRPAARKRGDLKRTKIIFAAATAFAKHGYNGTTLNDIAKAAGTQAGSLYYHFPSRDDITREVLKSSMSAITDNVNAAWAKLPPDTPLIHKIVLGIRVHLRVILSDDPFLPAYNRIINEVHPSIREEYVQYPRAYGAMWRDLLTKSQEAGEIRSSIDASVARLLLFGSITWTQLWFNPKGERSADEIADELIDIYFNGMLTDAGKNLVSGENMAEILKIARE